MRSVGDLEQLFIALGNARMMKKHALTSDIELAALEEEHIICRQINNYFVMNKMYDTKGVVVLAGKYKEYRNWDLRSSIDLSV